MGRTAKGAAFLEQKHRRGGTTTFVGKKIEALKISHPLYTHPLAICPIFRNNIDLPTHPLVLFQ